MRKMHAAIRVVAISSTPADVVVPVETRQTLIFSAHPTETYTVSTVMESTVGRGLTIVPGGGSLILRREDIGDLICQRWFAVSTNAVSIGILEAYEERPTESADMLHDIELSAQRVDVPTERRTEARGELPGRGQTR